MSAVAKLMTGTNGLDSTMTVDLTVISSDGCYNGNFAYATMSQSCQLLGLIPTMIKDFLASTPTIVYDAFYALVEFDAALYQRLPHKKSIKHPFKLSFNVPKVATPSEPKAIVLMRMYRAETELKRARETIKLLTDETARHKEKIGELEDKLAQEQPAKRACVDAVKPECIE
jgi:hypothetical protein